MIKTYDLHLPKKKNKPNIHLGDLLNIETFIRLNPHWIVKELESDPRGFSLQGNDHESEEPFTLQGTIEESSNKSVTLTFDSGYLISLQIQENGGHFKAVAKYRDESLEQSIEYQAVTWIRSIQEYLRLYLGKSINALLFRFLMNRVILKMSPSQRKISLMLIRITILEIVAILVIVIGYVFFVK